MVETYCPFCGAEPEPRSDHPEWTCRSGMQGDKAWQSEACKLIVAEATIDRLRTELSRRDEAIDSLIADTVKQADASNAGLCSGLGDVIYAMRTLKHTNKRIHHVLDNELG